MKLRRSRSVMVAVLLGALTLGACSGSDDGQAAGDGGTAVPEAGPAARGEEFAQYDAGGGDEARTAARLPTVGRRSSRPVTSASKSSAAASTHRCSG